jgi:tetratricopeptide (TPR) repeat protein
MTQIIVRYFFLLLFSFCCQKLPAQNTTSKIIDSLNEVLKNTNDDTNRVKTLNALGWYLRITGEYKRGREIAETAAISSDKLNFKRGKASALNLIGLFCWDKGDLTNAIYYFKSCIPINEEIGNTIGLGNNLINIGNIYWGQGNYTDAAKYYKSASKVYEEAGNTQGLVWANNNLGATYAKCGNNPDALKYYLEALKISQNLDDESVVAMCYGNIGTLDMEMRNYPEALKKFQTALSIYQRIENKAGIAEAYSKIGEIYEKQANYTAALTNFTKALNVFIELELPELTAIAYNNIGSVHLHQSDYPEALRNFKSAVEILEKSGSKGNIALSYIYMGETISKQASLEKDKIAGNRKNKEAVQIINKGLSIANEIGSKEHIRNAYRVLSDVYKGMNDYKSALHFYCLYGEMKDSLLNNETRLKLEQLRTEYEVEKAVAEEKVKQETLIAKQNADHKRKNELLLTGLGIFVIISFFTILLIRQRNQKKRGIEKAEVGHKMAELELQSLRAQLNPHFMFNSLNAIQDLILKEDNDRSHLYLSRFSKLLRMLLDNANLPFITIKQELELIELYLSLENLRIPNLQYSIESDPKLSTEERMIPNMMLQPYIENAIWHGLSNKKGDRKLQVRIHENTNATEFEIEDNGIGRKKAAEIKSLYRKGHTSKGMELLSKRFNLLSKEYGEAIQTTVTDLGDNGDATGTLVKIDVPFSLSEQAKLLTHDTNHHN